MQKNLAHTIWTLTGPAAARDMRFSVSPRSMDCTGFGISNYQPKVEGGQNRLEIKV